MLSIASSLSLATDSSLSNSNFSNKHEVSQTNLQLSNNQRTLEQRLIKAKKKLDLKLESSNLSLVQDEVSQIHFSSLWQPTTSNMGISTVSNFIIRYSFSLQKAEQQHLGERVYATSDMNSIRYLLRRPLIDLAVFDVDDTLITCPDPYYDVHILPKTPLSQRMLAINEVKRDLFFMGTLAIRSWAIIEPQTPQLISEFQSNGVKVIALTALWPAIHKNLNLHIPNWRVRHLKTFGYDFSKSFPISCLYGFGGPDSQNPLEPYFKKGVMFSGEVPKGKALLSFLSAISFKPKSVLFVDDNINNVYNVYRELSRVGIECHSILYTRTQKYPAHSMFSKEEYDSCLKRQEESVEEFLRLETIHEAMAQKNKVYPDNGCNMPQPHKQMTWLAPSSSSSSLSRPSPNNDQNCSLVQKGIEQKGRNGLSL